MIIVSVRLLEESRWQDTLEALQSIEAGEGIPEREVHAWVASWAVPTRESLRRDEARLIPGALYVNFRPETRNQIPASPL